MTVNSSKNLSPDAAYSAIGAKGKLVTFEKNADGKLIKITTATESNDINEDVFTLNINEENVVYRASSSKLTASDMSVSVGADTLIFDIPNGASKDEYAVRSKAVLVDGGLYDVMVFDVGIAVSELPILTKPCFIIVCYRLITHSPHYLSSLRPYS